MGGEGDLRVPRGAGSPFPAPRVPRSFNPGVVPVRALPFLHRRSEGLSLPSYSRVIVQKGEGLKRELQESLKHLAGSALPG